MIKNILIVEDDMNVRELYKHTLEEEGYYNIIMVENVKQAIEKIEEVIPNLIITDIKMPGGQHGLDLLEYLNKHHPKIPVIICTAFPHMKNDYIVASSNVVSYMVKPFDIQELKQKVKEILK